MWIGRIILVGVLISISSWSYADSDGSFTQGKNRYDSAMSMYKQVFGEQSRPKQLRLNLVYNQQVLGELTTYVSAKEQIEAFDSSELLQMLRPILDDSSYRSILSLKQGSKLRTKLMLSKGLRFFYNKEDLNVLLQLVPRHPSVNNLPQRDALTRYGRQQQSAIHYFKNLFGPGETETRPSKPEFQAQKFNTGTGDEHSGLAANDSQDSEKIETDPMPEASPQEVDVAKAVKVEERKPSTDMHQSPKSGEKTSSPSSIDLFSKVFGKTKRQEKVSLNVIYQNRVLGEVTTQLSASEELEAFESANMLALLKQVLDEESLQAVQAVEQEGQLSLAALQAQQLELDYNREKLNIELDFPLEKAIRQVSSSEGSIPKWAINAIPPEAFSAYLNYNLKDYFASGSHTLDLSLDTAVQLYGVVLEHNSRYQNRNGWSIGDTRFVADDLEHQVRYNLGDLRYSVTGFQSQIPLAGISGTKHFGIDPYQIITPINEQEFILDQRSQVKVYVNGVYQKTLNLEAGKHSIQDFSLNSGQNDILLEIEGRNGEKTSYQFDISSASRLLRKDLAEFSWALGVSYEDQAGRRLYDEDDRGLQASLFYRQGYTNNWTGGFFAQIQEEQQLYGVETILATGAGNFSSDLSASEVDGDWGAAFKLDYEFINSDSAGRLSLGYENLDKFARFGAHELIYQKTYSLNYSNQIWGGVYGALGLSYSNAQKEVREEAYSIKGTLSRTWFGKLNSNVSIDAEQAEGEEWDLSVDLNLSLSLSAGKHASASYQSESNTQTLNYRQSSAKPLNAISWDLGLVNEEEQGQHLSNLNLDYSTSLFNASLGQKYKKSDEHEVHSTSFDMGSALVFTRGSFGLSRPVTDSFAIVSANKHIDGQVVPISTRSSSAEAEVNDWGAGVIPSLSAYRYAKLNLDPSLLDEGYSIGREVFVLAPGYKTGHYFEIGEAARVTLIGKLKTENGAPIPLVVGEIKSMDSHVDKRWSFFTSRKGNFVVEGLLEGDYEVHINGDAYQAFGFSIPEGVSGIYRAETFSIREH